MNKRSVPFIGYHSNEIPITRMAGIRTECDLELFKDIHLEIMANVAAIDETESMLAYSFLAGYGHGNWLYVNNRTT